MFLDGWVFFHEKRFSSTTHAPDFPRPSSLFPDPNQVHTYEVVKICLSGSAKSEEITLKKTRSIVTLIANAQGILVHLKALSDYL